MLHQNKWQLSCHQIRWCKVLLFFTVHWLIIKYDQKQSQIIAFIFYGTKKGLRFSHTQGMEVDNVFMIIKRYKKVGYNKDIMRQSACRVVNPNTFKIGSLWLCVCTCFVMHYLVSVLGQPWFPL